MKRIRILEAIRQGSVGGGETHVYDLTTRLNKDAFEPIVLSFTDGAMVDNLRAAGIETHVIHSRFPFDPRVYYRVFKLIKDRKIALIHAHGTRAASNLLFPALFSKIKLIYTIHGWSFNDSQSGSLRFIRRHAERFITSRAALNICVSTSNLSTGKQAIPGFKATVINNGISFEKFNPSVDNSRIISELNIKPQEVWIGLIARITKQKDPITLLNAFSIAQTKNSNLRLLIVGQGDLEREVREKIQELNLQEKTLVLPFRSDIPEILKTISIYCLPSLWEGLPIGLIEAMAMSKAVIATEVDGTREIINARTGLPFQKENPEDLAAKILLLAGDFYMRQTLGLEANKLVREKFEVQKMVLATENQYVGLL
jgi:glycosyltransferase involved in cell wall biosynthesis